MGPEALLKALAEWVRAEAADVRIASPRANAAAAKRYVALLGDWAGRIGGTQRWAIPRVSKGLRQAARAVSEEREGRFDLAVLLYRRELNKKGAVVRKDSRRARTDAEQACAVRAAALPSVRCGRVLRSLWLHPCSRCLRRPFGAATGGWVGRVRVARGAGGRDVGCDRRWASRARRSLCRVGGGPLAWACRKGEGTEHGTGTRSCPLTIAAERCFGRYRPARWT